MTDNINKYFNIDNELLELSQAALEKCSEAFKKIELTASENQYKVIKAFHNCRVSETHFIPTTGYGYGDRGRDTLDEVFSEIFKTEDAIVRQSIASGTVAITTAMFANLRPGEEILFATGKPYDTLLSAVGINGNAPGSMKDYGITYKIVDLLDDRSPDFKSIGENINSKTKMVFIQRSRGYQWGRAVTNEDIKRISDYVKERNKNICVMVDNCYGEFVDTVEPTQTGADLMAGSLIKNPGGGICPSGGYIAGGRKYIENCASRLYSPGLGKEVGCSITDKRLLFQGIFLAPHTVGESLKGSVFIAAILELLGYETSPSYNEKRNDIIQLVKFENESQLVSFCQGVQEGSPVDAHVRPYPWDMPGYEDKVIMAAGTFVSGASIEFSADAPVRHPYIAYMQGGLTFSQVKLGVLLALQRMKNHEII